MDDPECGFEHNGVDFSVRLKLATNSVEIVEWSPLPMSQSDRKGLPFAVATARWDPEARSFVGLTAVGEAGADLATLERLALQALRAHLG